MIKKLLEDYMEAQVILAKEPLLLFDYCKGTPLKKVIEKSKKWRKEADKFIKKMEGKYK